MKPQRNIIRTTLLTVTVACFMLSCSGAVDNIKGDGVVTTVPVELGPHSVIDISGVFDVYITEGDKPGLKVVTDQNLHQYIKVETRNDKVYISMTRIIANLDATEMDIYITPDDNLKRLSLSGAVSVSADHVIDYESLDIEVNGAGRVDLKMNVEKLETSVSGAGDIKYQGEADQHIIRLTGAANLESIGLRTNSTDVRLSGAGKASVYATRTLNASVSGVGKITYGGNPQKTNLDISGLGTIRPIEQTVEQIQEI